MADAAAAGDDGSGGSGSDDDSSSSSEEVEVDDADMERVMKLEASLEANANQYDTHLEYIALLRKCRLRERARAARERMHGLFPFNEAQWREWLGDEMDCARDATDLDRIKGLYRRAVRDYLSLELWESYLEFLHEMDREVAAHSAAGAAAFRAAAEDALTAGGLHLSEGHRLWAALRRYEAEGLAGAEAASKGAARERVRGLWQRQLAVPLAGGEALMAEYEAWEAGEGQGAVPDHVRKSAERARSAAALRASHEAAVGGGRSADAGLLAAYLAYIKLEQAQGDPARVQVMFERAVAAFPVTAELWLQYASYLEKAVKIAAVVDATYARARRNCPWVGALWARSLRALERGGGGGGGGGGGAAHEEVYQDALKAGMQGPEDYMEVLLARADFLRRAAAPPAADAAADARAEAPAAAAGALRAHFASAVGLMAQYFPDYVDRALRLPGYWAHAEAFVLRDAGAAREVWEAALKGPLGRYYETWAAYVAMERALRAVPQARGVYRRAWSRKLEEGGQLAVCCDWLRFEREEGRWGGGQRGAGRAG
ncbi:MAG: hypothetical protein J3K34DRAFT_452483 [Monoraphidium minutum]|nr:MAG: hypothetical protein J3K34DRAFT_452483 [Monoraphidium minutum]